MYCDTLSHVFLLRMLNWNLSVIGFLFGYSWFVIKVTKSSKVFSKEVAGAVSPLNNRYVSIPQDVKRIALFFCALATSLAVKIAPGAQRNFANLLCSYHNQKVFQSYLLLFVMYQRWVWYVNLYDLLDTTFLYSFGL